MGQFSEGDYVRVDIPNNDDPDHATYHGTYVTIVSILPDAADAVTGNERDAVIYRVALDSGEQADFRLWDLRPSITDP